MLTGTERHPHARAVLGAALAPGGAPSHAYLFSGPAGSGKRTVARAFATALLTDGVADPQGAAARVAHGAHPDLTWVAPASAAGILVGDVDEAVVAGAARTPFEASRRVFVIEDADELNDQAANRMLKTLEEPPSFAHLILLDEPARRGAADDRQPLPAGALRRAARRADRRAAGASGDRAGAPPTPAPGSGSATRRARWRSRSARGRRCAPAPRPSRAARCATRSRAGRGPCCSTTRAPREPALVPGSSARSTTSCRSRSSRTMLACAARPPSAASAPRAARRPRRSTSAWRSSGSGCAMSHASPTGYPSSSITATAAAQLEEDAARGHGAARLRAAQGLVEATRASLQFNPNEELALDALGSRLARTLRGAG